MPEHTRSDNGAQVIAKSMRLWLSKLGVKTLYIEPGSPWENGITESFNSRLRDELLKVVQFSNAAHARASAAAWREDYNEYRPHQFAGRSTPGGIRTSLCCFRFGCFRFGCFRFGCACAPVAQRHLPVSVT